jgi:two-component system sensor histidine kinase KdpD
MYFIIALVNAVLTFKIRQAEKKVREQEERANAVKFYNTLLNSLSHELRTPITTIIGAADNLQSNGDHLSEQNRSELVNEISVASSRLNDQVKNLLNMSRMEAGIIKPKKDWTDVGELIHSVVNNFSSTREIEIGLAENLPLFNLDYALLEQILYNLLSNAVQYTPGDSSITVRARCGKEVISNSINMEKVIDKLIISVSDNGPGFPNSEIGRVFEKFYRLPKTKAGGTGLGLSIVKGFTEVQGGKVKLENLPTGGAKFTVEIPGETSYVNALKNE